MDHEVAVDEAVAVDEERADHHEEDDRQAETSDPEQPAVQSTGGRCPSRPSRAARKAAKACSRIAARAPSISRARWVMLWTLTSRWARISPRLEEVAEVGAGEPRACRTGALGVDRAELVPDRGIAQREPSVGGQRAAVARQARGGDAVEHVHPERDRREQFGVRPQPHEVARLVPGELGDARLGHRQHGLERLAHRQASDRHPVEAEPGHESRQLMPVVRIEASLGDAEEAGVHRRDGLLGSAPPSGGSVRWPPAPPPRACRAPPDGRGT